MGNWKGFLVMTGKVFLAVVLIRTAANFVPVVGPMAKKAMDQGLIG